MNLKIISKQQFREKLAGLHYELQKINNVDISEIKILIIRYCSILASLFGNELDRKTLWEKISSSIISAASKVEETDIDNFVNYCLESIQAEHSKVATSQELLSILTTIEHRPVEWKKEFMRYIKAKHFIIVVHARNRWEQYKKGEIEL